MEKPTQHQLVVADPSAIGLFGLAMVTLVASSQKLGFTEGTSLILPWAIFLGALAQLFAASLEAKKNNAFGMTAFAGYGFFWLAIAMTWMVQHGLFGESMLTTMDLKELGLGFLGYLIFTLFMTIGALETNKVLFFIFVLIDGLFLGLTLSTLFNSHFGHVLAGVSELLISLLSFYGSAAAVLNTHFGFTFLPTGKPFGVIKKKA